MKYGILFLLMSIIPVSATAAGGVYQKPAEFLREVFSGEVPRPSILWLTGKVRAETESILGHKPDTLRLRYWKSDKRSAWILEEIGKEKPITVGIVIHRGRIENIRVLIFRESRGWEVRHSFFTDQFINASLATDNKLDRTIDGITGATLSVRALSKLAKLALYLSSQIKKS